MAEPEKLSQLETARARMIYCLVGMYVLLAVWIGVGFLAVSLDDSPTLVNISASAKIFQLILLFVQFHYTRQTALLAGYSGFQARLFEAAVLLVLVNIVTTLYLSREARSVA